MRRKYYFVALVIISIGMTGGCFSYTPDEMEKVLMMETDTNENPFENDLENKETQIVTVGSLGHGLNNVYGTPINFQYEGGELEIPYKANAEGIAKNSGFFIYLDGVLQPYKIKGITEEYEYMHIFNFSEVQEEFTFTFTPITGEKGKEMEICIVGVVNPDFKVDLKDSFAYGHSHSMSETIIPVTFLEAPEIIDFSVMNGRELIKNVELSTVDLTNEMIVSDEEKRGSKISIDKDVITNLYIDENDMWVKSMENISERESVHVLYKIYGHPGVRYKTSFYIDHQIITSLEGKEFEYTLEAGKAETIEFDLDVSRLMEDSTFYVVSVPCNVKDYPNDAITLQKFRSMLLYREIN